MEEFRLCNSDYRFMMLVWEHTPIGSGELVKLCAEKLGWKKSTTYTEIKRLCEKGVLQRACGSDAAGDTGGSAGEGVR